MHATEIDPRSFTDQQIENFHKKIRKGDPDECWPWIGAKTRSVSGGTYGAWSKGQKNLKAHRVAYALSVGPIPQGMTIDHVKPHCVTGYLCCNPAHLEPVTLSENQKRGWKTRIGDRNYCICGNPRSVRRQCKECRAAYQRRFALKRKMLRLEKLAQVEPSPK